MSASDEAGVRHRPRIVDVRTLEALDRRRRAAVVCRRAWLVRRVLLAGDVLGLALAFSLAGWAGGLDAPAGAVPFAASLPAWLAAAALAGLYERDEERTRGSTASDLRRLLPVVAVWTCALWGLSAATGLVHPAAAALLLLWAAAGTLVAACRAAGRALARRRVVQPQNTVIVGADAVGQRIARNLLERPEERINVVGFVDESPRERHPDLQRLAVLGTPRDLPALVRLLDVERVIVPSGRWFRRERTELVRTLERLHVQVDLVPLLVEAAEPRAGRSRPW